MADLLEPEFADAFKAWKTTPTPATNSAVLKAVSPVIDSAMTSFGGSGGSTLRSRAKLLTLQALPSYDPSRGSLRTHLLGHLQRLRRVGADSQNIIRIPEAVALNFQHLSQAEAEFRDRFGREPSDSEIADRTGLSLKRITHIRKSQLPVSEGMTQVPSAEGDIHDPAVNARDPRQTAWEDFVYHDLGRTDQFIMDAALGRNGRRRMSVGAIAAALGVTAGAVSQRAKKIEQLLSRDTFTEIL